MATFIMGFSGIDLIYYLVNGLAVLMVVYKGVRPLTIVLSQLTKEIIFRY